MQEEVISVSAVVTHILLLRLLHDLHACTCARSLARLLVLLLTARLVRSAAVAHFAAFSTELSRAVFFAVRTEAHRTDAASLSSAALSLPCVPRPLAWRAPRDGGS
jgi:hypothetical protein